MSKPKTKSNRNSVRREQVEKLAMEIFDSHSRNGTLKPPRTLAVLITSSGHRRIATSPTTYRDYLPEAQEILDRGGNQR